MLNLNLGLFYIAFTGKAVHFPWSCVLPECASLGEVFTSFFPFLGRSYLATLTLFSVPSQVSPAKSGDSITVTPGTWLGVPGLPSAVSFTCTAFWALWALQCMCRSLQYIPSLRPPKQCSKGGLNNGALRCMCGSLQYVPSLRPPKQSNKGGLIAGWSDVRF